MLTNNWSANLQLVELVEGNSQLVELVEGNSQLMELGKYF